MPGKCSPINSEGSPAATAIGASLKVPFARCADGIARHVSMASRLEHGPFICLGCGEGLLLREPLKARTHFAHMPGSMCGGVETVLHRYAKELFLRSKTLTLPSRKLEFDGLYEIVVKESRWKFDTVLLEHRVGEFQPDALALSRDVELLVEFRVTHAVDSAKRSKVEKHDVSMVEIDLSHLAALEWSAEKFDHAILHSSPRQWIHHRKEAAARKKLNDRVAARSAERGGRLAKKIETPPPGNLPNGWNDEATLSVNQVGLGHLVNFEVPHEHWFTVPRHIWQASALEALIVARCRKALPENERLYVRSASPNEKSLHSGLPSWMIRSDLAELDLYRLAEAGYDKGRLGTPSSAVWYYLRALNDLGGIVLWDPEEKEFFVSSALHGYIYRENDTRALARRLLLAADSTDPEGDYTNWSSVHLVDNVPVRNVIVTGGPAYDTFRQQLRLLERMVSPFGRTTVDDLCGLPLEAVREQAVARVAAEELDRKRRNQEIADARRASIRNEANYWLGLSAGSWLSGPSEIEGISMMDFAAQSDEAKFRVSRAMELAHHQQKKNDDAETLKASCRERLKQHARAAFRDPAKAELFVNSSQHKLAGRRPIDYCDNDATLKTILALLPKRS
jgi:hypothetical protein